MRQLAVSPTLLVVAILQGGPAPLDAVPTDATTRVAIGATSVYYVANRGGTFRLLSRPAAAASMAADEELYRAPQGFVVLSPTLSPDGRRLYFESNHRVPTIPGREDTDVWFVERTAQGWSAPRALGPPFNTAYNEHAPTVDAIGRICFNSSRPGSQENDIYCGRIGDSSAPTRQAALSSPAEEASPGLSADGSLIVFTSNRAGGAGGWDIYVSRRNGDAWSAPRSLGPSINSPADELAVSLSAAGDAVYFFRPADASGPRRGYQVPFEGVR